MSALARVLEEEVMDRAEESAAYDAMDHGPPTEAIVQRLMQLGGGGRMIDLGVGPGHIPIGVCQAIAGCTVPGVDLAEQMLVLACERIRAAGLDQRIDLKRADAKNLPFADASFDVAFSNTILHHLADPGPMLIEAWRVVRPGGVLVIRDLYRPPTAQRLDELVETHAADCTALQRQLLFDSLRAALTPDELRDLAESSGWSNFEVTIDSDRHMILQVASRA